MNQQLAPSTPSDVVEDLFSHPTEKFLLSAISREEGQFLKTLASEAEIRSTIEIGCANGVSTLHICWGLSGKDDVFHLIVDPNQTTYMQRKGIANVERAGFKCFRLLEEPSELALPDLLRSGACFDMAFIDGFHTADQTMVDFYYLDRMLRVGGILVVDDVASAPVNKIVRYISTYPNYQLIGTCGDRGKKRRTINAVKRCLSTCLWPVRKTLGDELCREFVEISLIYPQALRTIDFCTMAAFRKAGEYNRDTNWYRGL
jgi:predicted O-methyltransferase YrrM